MKALTNLIGEIIVVVLLVAFSAAYLKYHEYKKRGEEASLTKEITRTTHEIVIEAKEGWNEAKKDSIK